VIEVTTRSYPAWTTLGGSTGSTWVTGDAVFVDLGEGPGGNARYLIALLVRGKRGRDVDFYLLPTIAFKHFLKGDDRVSGSVEVSRLPIGTTAALFGDLIPTLVTFLDLRDPSSARVVPPDNLAQTFGDGFRMRDVFIEIVSPGVWPLTLVGLTGEPISSVAEATIPQIMARLRENVKVSRGRRVDDPYTPSLGQFTRY
jgi:hypothetical protein